MKTKMNVRDSIKSNSVGVIEKLKTRSNGDVKYKIAYNDYNGRKHSAWTTWMRNDGHVVGDSIPVRNFAIPSFGLVNIPLSVNNHPQRYVEPYIAAMVLTGIGALIAGYSIGKNSKR